MKIHRQSEFAQILMRCKSPFVSISPSEAAIRAITQPQMLVDRGTTVLKQTP
jgi:hypothetical protein